MQKMALQKKEGRRGSNYQDHCCIETCNRLFFFLPLLHQDGCTFSCYPQTVHFLFLSLIQKGPLNFSLLDFPFFYSEIMQSNILASSSKQKSTFGVCHSKKPFMSWRRDNCKRVLLAEKLSVMIFLMAMTETLLVPLTAKSANGTFEFQQQKIHTTELITILPVKNLQTGNTKFQLVAHQHSIPFFSRSLPLHCIRSRHSCKRKKTRRKRRIELPRGKAMMMFGIDLAPSFLSERRQIVIGDPTK